MDSVSDIPPGIYRGTVRGIESGDCTARIVERSRASCRRTDC